MEVLGKWFSKHVEWRLHRSKRYCWYVLTPRVSRETIAPLVDEYLFHAAGGRMMERLPDGSVQLVSRDVLARHRRLTTKRVVYMCDGRTLAGGLTDRFKGILSLYALCEELGYEFRIHYTSPFLLATYLQPASYDWQISAADLHPEKSAMLVLENTDDAPYQTRKQVQWLRRRLQESPEEVHVITNSNYAYTQDYASLFHHLFRFSDALQKSLLAETASIDGGRAYVSISARFLNVLGDFTETAASTPLPEAEAEALIERSMAQVEAIHARHAEQRVLVTSDSERFISRVKTLPYVHVVEGGVAHTDLMPHDNAERMHLKLFLDFLLIAGAERVYMLRSGKMRESGFPYAASRLYERPFEKIEY